MKIGTITPTWKFSFKNPSYLESKEIAKRLFSMSNACQFVSQLPFKYYITLVTSY